jgi:gliding motility-associated-like protein
MKRFNNLFIIFSVFAGINQALAQVPNIVNVDKISGTYAERVTISGNGFSDNKANLDVQFGASKGQIVNSTEYLIEVLVPAGATYHNISVTNLISKSTGYSKDYFNLAFSGRNELEESRIIESNNIQEDAELFDLCNCDFNGDGLNDVATTNNSDAAPTTSITVYQNITQESDFEISFQKINDPNLRIGKGARNITCGDLNGDGKAELIVGKGGSSADKIFVFKNISSFGIDFDQYITIGLSEVVSSSTTRKLIVHDMDMDGKPDIIMTDQGEGKVFIFGNKSTANSIVFPTSARQTIQMAAESLIGLDVADLNNDGKPEIVCNSDKTDVFILPNESVAGNIKMGTPQSKTIEGSRLVNLKIGDLDNDGDKDIVITNLVNNIYILVNTGSMDSFSFGSPKYVETGRAPWGMDFGDLNGDGLVDIVVGTTDATDKVTALINKSNLLFIPSQIGRSDVSFNVNVADFNGDGKPDIAYNDRGNDKLIFLRNAHCVIPDISPTNPAAVCAASPVTLRATPALKADYIWTNTGTNDVVSGDIKADITMVGNYNVSIQSANDGCAETSIEVTLEDGGNDLPPVVVITSPGAVCEGSDFTLSTELIAGVNYAWRTPDESLQTGNEITITGAAIEDGGRYSLVLESASGCRTDPVFEMISIGSLPAMEISSSGGAIFCEGSTNELSSPFVPQATYEWKNNNNVISGATSNVYSTTEPGTYVVSVVNSFSCNEISEPLVIRQVTQPVATFGEITSSCLNEPILFENNSTYDDTEPAVFNWNFGDGNTSNEENPTHTYLVAGDYTISLEVGYDNTSCNDIYETTLSVVKFIGLEIMANDEPVPDAIFNLCDGNIAELSVSALPGQVEWNTGETTPKITISEPGIYSVASGSNTGCTSNDEIEAVLVDNVEVIITSGSQKIEGGGSARLEAEGADFYQWKPADDLDDPTIPNPLASPLETTVYMVSGTNSYGCEDKDSVTVYVDVKIAIPVDAAKVFSPNNGDMINNEWEIVNIDVFESCPIRIVNRRGQTVYEASQYNNDWDGTLNGKDLPEGAYYYVLSCGASDVHTGSIAIIR